MAELKVPVGVSDDELALPQCPIIIIIKVAQPSYIRGDSHLKGARVRIESPEFQF